MAKKKRYIRSALLLIICLLMTACSEAVPTSSAPVSGSPTQAQTPTGTEYSSDRLVLYVNPYIKPIYQDALAIFQERYPTVEVDFREFGTSDIGKGIWEGLDEESGAHHDALTMDMNLGQGPDVLIAQPGTFWDINKMSQDGKFFDLNLLLENDQEFNLSPFTEEIINVGVLNGKRYTIPISYSCDALVTTEEALADAGIDPVKELDIETLTAQVEQYEQLHANDMSKIALYYDANGGGYSVRRIMQFSGLEPMNYENGQIDVDSDAFRSVLQNCRRMYQAMIPKLNTNRDSYAPNGSTVLNGKRLYEFNVSPVSVARAINLLQQSATPILYPLPSISGETVVYMGLTAGIPSYSSNKENAYRFIQILLSEEIQRKHADIPVRTDEVKNKILACTGNLEDEELLKQFDINLDRAIRLQEEWVERMITFYTQDIIPQNMTMETEAIIYDNLRGYIQWEGDYEQGLSKIKDQLRYLRDE